MPDIPEESEYTLRMPSDGGGNSEPMPETRKHWRTHCTLCWLQTKSDDWWVLIRWPAINPPHMSPQL